MATCCAQPGGRAQHKYLFIMSKQDGFQGTDKQKKVTMHRNIPQTEAV